MSQWIAQHRRMFTWTSVCLAVVVLVLILTSVVHTEEPIQPPPIRDRVALARSLADEGHNAEAIRELIAAFESEPSALRLDDYERLCWDAYLWFSRIPQPERIALLGEFDSGAAVQVPLGVLAGWLDALLPATSVRSSGSMLLLAGCHRQLSDMDRAEMYAMAAFENGPDTPDGELAVQFLMTWQHYAHDRDGMERTAWAAAQSAPEGWTTSWAIVRIALGLCSSQKPDEAMEVCDDVRHSVPDTKVAETAVRFNLFIEHIEQMDYPAAVECVWPLVPYMFEAPGQDIFHTLCLGIDWPPDDAESQARLQQLTTFAEAASESAPDPSQRACMWLVLAHCADWSGNAALGGAYYQKAIDSGEARVEQYALRQLARICAQQEPERAIACLETHFEKFGAVAVGHETQLLHLGRLYRRVGRYQDGLDLLADLQARREAGEALMRVPQETLIANIVGCLDGLGRNAEAQALADPLLAGRGYQADRKDIEPACLGYLSFLLRQMGRIAEAEKLERTLLDSRR